MQWKAMFAERFRLRRNWLNGYCNVRTFEGHTQGQRVVVGGGGGGGGGACGMCVHSFIYVCVHACVCTCMRACVHACVYWLI